MNLATGAGHENDRTKSGLAVRMASTCCDSSGESHSWATVSTTSGGVRCPNSWRTATPVPAPATRDPGNAGIFRLSVNYWPAEQAMDWLAAYHPEATRRDFGPAKAGGPDRPGGAPCEEARHPGVP